MRNEVDSFDCRALQVRFMRASIDSKIKGPFGNKKNHFFPKIFYFYFEINVWSVFDEF